MKNRILSVTLLLLLVAIANHSEPQQPKKQVFYAGTYTGTESKGIYSYLLHPDGSMEAVGLAAETPNPSFIAKTTDNKYLLAISEVSAKDKTGLVRAYSIENNSLTFISESTSGGAHPCHVSVNEQGYVVVSNYTGGNMALLQVDQNGQLSELLDLQQHEGSGITDRQKGPHAHSARFDPKNGNIIAADLGTNELWISKIDYTTKKLVPAEPQTLKMNPGAGPRHFDFHPNGEWIYVVNELDCTVSLITRGENNQYKLEKSVTTLPEEFEGKNTCADIHISSDGKFVYASNRGHNSIVIFSVNKKIGQLTPAGHQSVHGEIPRNFSLSPDNKFLLVANQNTNNIVSFKRDKKTGQLQYISEIAAPKPVCILF